MAQHDYTIANQGFPAFRSDLNDALAAIVSNNSGATEPTTMFAHQMWVDTAADPSILKIRNADNDAWITIGTINQTGDIFTLTSAVSATTLNTSGAVVFNDAGADVDFRVEGDTNANLLFVDASVDSVGIGTSSIDYVSGGRTVVHVEGSAGALLALEDTGAKSYIFQNSNDLLLEVDNASGNMIFGTNNSTERMRLTSAGELLVGTTAIGAISSGTIEVKFDGSIANGIFYNDTRTSAGNDNAAVFCRGSTVLGFLRTTTTDVSLANLSDQRVKTNIQNSNSAIDLVDSVQVRQFDWTIDDSHEDFGFVAQELNEVFPQAVSVGKTEEEMWGVNLSKLVPVLTKAIQELKAELDTVKAELATLKG